MAEMNKVIIIGNLTKDPEIVNTSGNTVIANFRVAVNRTWRDNSGTTNNDVCFIDVKAWGKNAETIQKYCKKGKMLLIDGRLTMDTWDAKDGSGKRSKVYITLESFQFLGSPSGSNDASPATAGPATTQVATEAPEVKKGNYDGIGDSKAPAAKVVTSQLDSVKVSKQDLDF